MELVSGIHHFDTGPFNWYIIEESSRLTLVDAGFPGHYRVFRNAINELGYTLNDVEAIVITHAHADHTGFADRVAKESGAPVFIHEADQKLAGRILELPWAGLLGNAWRPYTAKMLGTAIWKGILKLTRISTSHTFTDGEVLDVPGKPVVMHVPGHTPGQSVLYLEDRNTLISSDALVTRNLYTGVLGGPQIPERGLNFDINMAERSLDRIAEIGAVTMLPGHGNKWFGSVGEAVDLARSAFGKTATFKTKLQTT